MLKKLIWHINKIVFCFSLGFVCVSAQTISEKKASLEPGVAKGTEILAKEINEKLLSLKADLEKKYDQAKVLSEKGVDEVAIKSSLQEIQALRKEIVSLEKRWREEVVSEVKREEEGYAFWDQDEITLSQLVREFGAADFVYIIPPELASFKMNIHSNIPVPRESWNEILELIFEHNGIGTKAINGFVKQLYILKQNLSYACNVVSRRIDLEKLSSQARVFYVFSPVSGTVKNAFHFFDRFSDNKHTFVYQINSKIMLVSSKEEVEKLLSLYETVWNSGGSKSSRIVGLSKLNVKEMEKILAAFFGESSDRVRGPFSKNDTDEITVFPLGQRNALVLVGQEEVISKAEKIIKDTEDQIQNPSEMGIYTYNCRHTDPASLAEVLSKVYMSLLGSVTEDVKDNIEVSYNAKGDNPTNTPDGYAPTPPLVVSPKPVQPEFSSKLEVEKGGDHFIPDPKTGNLLMVIRKDTYEKLKKLLKRLDVPKKMVKIEVLLFERQIRNENSMGFNLLNLGSTVNGALYTGLFSPDPSHKGVLEFFFQGAESKHFPAYDLAYSFLMAQEDVQLNAAPSVMAVNQTSATIAIQEERSINNGAAPIDTNKGVAFEKSFSRAQYGITLVFTPTIHFPESDDFGLEPEKGMITLSSDITFDTTKSNSDDRPVVERRHIKNEVTVSDGETVIIGGLRRKDTDTNTDKIPFLGEIPGLGRVFGSTQLVDSNTEMFFFITPKIIVDPKNDLIKTRMEDLKKRAGDTPEFLNVLLEAKKKEKKKFFQNSFKLFFGD